MSRKTRTLVLLEHELKEALDKKRLDSDFKVSMSVFMRGLIIAGARLMKVKLPHEVR